MGLEKLNSIYQTVIMDHYQHPVSKRKIDQPTHHMELLNPTCGDAIQLECRVEDQIIKEIGFTGHGCAISMASASMLMKIIPGKTITEAQRLVEEFNALIGGQSQRHMSDQEIKAEIKEAFLLENIKQFPARYKCAILAWRALDKGLKGEESGESI